MDRNEYTQRMKAFFGDDPKRDATTDISFVVDPVHISTGIKENPWACAIAAAAQDRGIQAIILKNVAWVKVPDTRSSTGRTNLRYALATNLHKKFDNGEIVEPVLVVLKAPTASLTLSSKSRANKATNRRRKDPTHVPSHRARTFSPPRGVA